MHHSSCDVPFPCDVHACECICAHAHLHVHAKKKSSSVRINAKKTLAVFGCNYEAKRHSPTCFGMQPNHGRCLLCCYTGYLGIFSSFLV